MKIVAALLAGNGIYEMAAQVLVRCVSDPLIDRVFIYTPPGKANRIEKPLHAKLTIIEQWLGKDSHDSTGLNREALRQYIRPTHDEDLPWDWFWFGDEDALPCPGYFEDLIKWTYRDAVLVTGKTYNLDGSRWYDICSFQTDSYPFCVPYDDWENPRWEKDLYASGNQHLMNREAFLLDTPYPDVPGEDPHFCWEFKRRGGQIIFRPELSMQLLKWHPPANYGYPPCLPK